MTKRTLTVLVLAYFFGSASYAIPIISISPVPSDPLVGTQVDVGVSVDPDGQFIGAYDLTLAFNPTVLSFDSVLFGPFLDGPLDSFQDVVPSGTDVNVAELSFSGLFNQDGFSSFSLFNVLFDVTGPGTSSLSLTVNDLSDFFGGPLDAEVRNSSVTGQQPTPVPEPGDTRFADRGAAWSFGSEATTQKLVSTRHTLFPELRALTESRLVGY